MRQPDLHAGQLRPKVAGKLCTEKGNMPLVMLRTHYAIFVLA